jgi:hypothetical protein
MKVWTDFSSLARMAALCVLIGFVLGLFVACSALPESTAPAAPGKEATLSGSHV